MMHTKIYKVVKTISVDAGMSFSLYKDDMFEFSDNKVTKLIYHINGCEKQLVISRDRHRSNLIYYKSSWKAIDFILEDGIIEDVTQQINRDRKINQIIN